MTFGKGEKFRIPLNPNSEFWYRLILVNDLDGKGRLKAHSLILKDH